MNITASELEILFFSLRVAALSTVLIVPPALFLAWAASSWRGRGAAFLEATCALPLVLPPTAIGFVLFRLLARNGPFGRLFDFLGREVLFTPAAAVIAASVMAFPLVFVSFRAALDASDRRLYDIARTLGANRMEAFLRVTVPLAWRGLTAGILLGYCRAIGEFGATVLIAGNIPGRTRTVAVAIYDRVQSGREEEASVFILFVVILAFAAVAAGEWLRSSQRRRFLG